MSPLLRRSGHWASVMVLASGLFWVGAYPDVLFAGLTAGWQAAMDRLGLAGWLALAQHGTSLAVTTRPLLVVASYSILYLALCLLLLRLLLPVPAARCWVGRFYLAAGALCATLLLLGKLSGDGLLLYRAGRTIIDFLVLPLPVVGLVALLYPSVRQHLPGVEPVSKLPVGR